MSVTLPTAAEFEALAARVSALERGTSGAEWGVITAAAQLPAFVRRGEINSPARDVEPIDARLFGIRPEPARYLWHPCPEAEATHRAIGERVAAPFDHVPIVPLGFAGRS